MSKNAKILIIEDDKDLVESMALVLESENYQVFKAYDTTKGMEILKKEKADLVILDVMFGNQGKTQGFDMALQIRNDKEVNHVLILMLTAINKEFPHFNFSPDSDSEYLPVDEFIDKPAEPKFLLEKVKILLEKKTSKWAN